MDGDGRPLEQTPENLRGRRFEGADGILRQV
jgi:hypothetical protein